MAAVAVPGLSDTTWWRWLQLLMDTDQIIRGLEKEKENVERLKSVDGGRMQKSIERGNVMSANATGESWNFRTEE